MAAAADRGQLEFDFGSASWEERKVALLFANAIKKKTMTRANLRLLKRICQRAG